MMIERTEDSISSIQDAEVAYLRSLVDVELKKKGQTFSVETDLIARNHTCTNICANSFKNMRCNQSFRHGGRSWHATGYVYVCATSKRVHFCGLACTLGRIMPYCANVTCPLTGLEIAQGECYARSREEIHVFRVGLSTVSDYVPSKNAEGLTEKKALESIAEQTEELNSQFQSNAERIIMRDLLLEERARLHPDEDEEQRIKNLDLPPALAPIVASSSLSIEGEGEGEEKIAMPHKASITLDLAALLFVAANNDTLMYDTIRKNPGLTTPEIAQKITARREFRVCATHTWERHSIKAEHVRHMQLALRRATVEWFKSIDLYYKSCISSNTPIDKLKIMHFFMLFVGPECEGLYYNFDIAALNIKSRAYYIDCLVAMWEKYQSVPTVANGTCKFKTCATAMLSALRTGLSVDVFFKPGDPQPRIWGDLNIVEQITARSVKIMLIDPHPNLVLVATEVLREMDNGERQDDVALEFPVGKKVVFPKPRSMLRGRSGRHNYHAIVDRKPLNMVLEHIIRYSPTLALLETFSLSVVYPKEKTPAYILRN